MERNRVFLFAAGLLAACIFSLPKDVPAQIDRKPENFWEFSVNRFLEGGDRVDVYIGGFRAKEFHYFDSDGLPHYRITQIERSDEVWKHNWDTGEWVQLKPYDASWLKVPPIAGHQALQNKLDGFIYCFGGRSANGDSAVYMLNMKTGQQINHPREQRIDLSRCPVGLYYLRVDTEAKPYFAKIVKR